MEMHGAAPKVGNRLTADLGCRVKLRGRRHDLDSLGEVPNPRLSGNGCKIASHDSGTTARMMESARLGLGAAASAIQAPLLELRHLSKRFPGVRALDDVSMAIHPGEVHMLLGENGAGKSSLIKVLYGAYAADSGEIHCEGQRVRIDAPADACRLGIAVIFQEFSLVPYLDIAQNQSRRLHR
jgi:ABC-type glutathione transport system ATPase component